MVYSDMHRKFSYMILCSGAKGFLIPGSQLTILGARVKAWRKFLTENLQIREPRYKVYRGADKSLARPTSRCILFDGENISFDASLVIYINSTNIPPIVIINRI
jgi:hypothetical protein